jgi:hypothetical protein
VAGRNGSADPGRDVGPTIFARIGVMRALNRHVERVFNPNRKDPRWGRRKLKREERNPRRDALGGHGRGRVWR